MLWWPNLHRPGDGRICNVILCTERLAVYNIFVCCCSFVVLKWFIGWNADICHKKRSAIGVHTSMIFFLLSESIFFTSTLPTFLQRNAWKFSAQNWWYWRVFDLKSSFLFLQFLWADFTNIPRALALRLTTSGANATHHLQNAPSLNSL